MKSILKEIFIILLLCLTICLVLGVIFYDYIPSNKQVPSTVEAYRTSNTIKDEISQEIVNYEKQNKNFEIEDSDLKLYKQDNRYDSGKANPFAITSTDASGSTTGSGNITGGNTTTNKNPDSTDLFFNSTGLGK